ncbi:MAG: pyrroline-5-carboxylate reductase [Brooklawnia sp.]|uniref:pyrroline-5-carboxylate reductase n=1 Tax=Brooklawnia sp. TaxID=2699740 RepID=UPI003C724754
MATSTLPVVVVGGGVMGGALASGLVRDDWTRVSIVEALPERRAQLADELGVPVSAELADLLPGAAVLVLAVKPNHAAAVLDQAFDLIEPGTLVLSICAGVTIAELADHLPAGTPIVRAMPNTPAQVGAGMAALSANQAVTDDQLQLAVRLMGAVGRAIVLPESLQDAVTAVSGSGPAYVFYLAEAMIEAGVQLGLTRQQSDELVRQTILGSAQLLAGGEHPAVLRERVTSPGGTTAAAIRQLDAHAVRAAISAAVWAAHDRSRG